MVKIIEQFIEAKTGRFEDCEDGIVVSDDFIAVIDGATDKTGLRYDNMTGGRYAMLACSDAIQTADGNMDAVAMVRHLTDILARRLPENLAPELRPVAHVGIYSIARNEVWQVNDVAYWHSGMPHSIPEKLVDHHSSGLRAAILNAELIRGATLDELASNDIGRKAIEPILTRQGLFCNNTEAGEWAYGAIDGREVPEELIKIHSVAGDITELVLASDGYPAVYGSLRETEENLANLLPKDPLCIGPLRSTKGIKPGQISFDDRSYIRFAMPGFTRVTG